MTLPDAGCTAEASVVALLGVDADCMAGASSPGPPAGGTQQLGPTDGGSSMVQCKFQLRPPGEHPDRSCSVTLRDVGCKAEASAVASVGVDADCIAGASAPGPPAGGTQQVDPIDGGSIMIQRELQLRPLVEVPLGTLPRPPEVGEPSCLETQRDGAGASERAGGKQRDSSMYDVKPWVPDSVSGTTPPTNDGGWASSQQAVDALLGAKSCAEAKLLLVGMRNLLTPDDALLVAGHLRSAEWAW